MTEAPAIRIEQHSISSRDQTLLHATLYRPHEANDHAVLIGAAMGIKQSFYRHYATYLAEQGFVVLTFDYRGIGESRKGNLWGDKSDLAQWGSQDLHAVLAWFLRQYPAHTVSFVAHSISAQLLGLTPLAERVAQLIGVSAQNTYWKLWSFPMNLAVGAFWYGALPLTSLLAGYFPSKLFGLGEDLPKGVARDWARAGRSRHALLDVYGGTEYNYFADFKGAMLLYSFSDDTGLAPKRSVDELAAFFPNARLVVREHLQPQDIQAASIGHLGFFRPEVKTTLWQSSAAWMLNPQAKPVVQPIAESTVRPALASS